MHQITDVQEKSKMSKIAKHTTRKNDILIRWDKYNDKCCINKILDANTLKDITMHLEFEGDIEYYRGYIEGSDYFKELENQ